MNDVINYMTRNKRYFIWECKDEMSISFQMEKITLRTLIQPFKSQPSYKTSDWNRCIQ